LGEYRTDRITCSTVHIPFRKATGMQCTSKTYLKRLSKNTYPLKLPTSVKKAAAELAATDGVSLNQFIAAAVAEKVGSLRAADDCLRERAGAAKPKDMLKYLRRAPKVAPNADDMP
jgi:hypothetical protein